MGLYGRQWVYDVILNVLCMFYKYIDGA